MSSFGSSTISLTGLWRDLLPIASSRRWSTGGGCRCTGFHVALRADAWRRTQVLWKPCRFLFKDGLFVANIWTCYELFFVVFIFIFIFVYICVYQCLLMQRHSCGHCRWCSTCRRWCLWCWRYSLRLLNQFFIGVCENPGEAPWLELIDVDGSSVHQNPGLATRNQL